MDVLQLPTGMTQPDVLVEIDYGPPMEFRQEVRQPRLRSSPHLVWSTRSLEHRSLMGNPVATWSDYRLLGETETNGCDTFVQTDSGKGGTALSGMEFASREPFAMGRGIFEYPREPSLQRRAAGSDATAFGSPAQDIDAYESSPTERLRARPDPMDAIGSVNRQLHVHEAHSRALIDIDALRSVGQPAARGMYVETGLSRRTTSSGCTLCSVRYSSNGVRISQHLLPERKPLHVKDALGNGIFDSWETSDMEMLSPQSGLTVSNLASANGEGNNSTHSGVLASKSAAQERKGTRAKGQEGYDSPGSPAYMYRTVTSNQLCHEEMSRDIFMWMIGYRLVSFSVHQPSMWGGRG